LSPAASGRNIGAAYRGLQNDPTTPPFLRLNGEIRRRTGQANSTTHRCPGGICRKLRREDSVSTARQPSRFWGRPTAARFRFQNHSGRPRPEPNLWSLRKQPKTLVLSDSCGEPTIVRLTNAARSFQITQSRGESVETIGTQRLYIRQTFKRHPILRRGALLFTLFNGVLFCTINPYSVRTGHD
jgi:hypothetical protein